MDLSYQHELMKDEARNNVPLGFCSDNVEVLGYAGYIVKPASRNGVPAIRKRHYWLCKCHLCGKKFFGSEDMIKSTRKLNSCGCQQHSGMRAYTDKVRNGEVKRRPRQMANIEEAKKYNCETGSLLYIKYHCMIGRCYNKGDRKYYRYGARGIKVAPIWLNDGNNNGLINFAKWACENGYNGTKFSLERLNNDADYSPDNCFICYSNYQQANNKSTVPKYRYGNFDYTMAELGRMYNGSYTKAESDRIRDRMVGGFTPLEAIFIPKGEHKRDYAGDAGYYIHNPDKVVCPIYFIDYPQVDPRDPLLQYMTVDKVAFIREKEAEANYE